MEVETAQIQIDFAPGNFDKFQAGDCYQCGKCTAGCPVAGSTDYAPNRIVRFVQTGKLEKALGSEAIWQCVYCQTCSSRCPKSVDCAGLMDQLRRMSIERAAVAPSRRRTVIFQKAFLQNVRRNGRLNEIELAGAFKASAFLNDLAVPFLFKDAMLAPKMSSRKKLHLRGERVRDRAVVGRIFDRCLNGR